MTRNFKQSWEKRKNNFPLGQMVTKRAPKLEDAQNEWKVIFDAIEEGISIHDSNFNILDANQSLAREKAFGVTSSYVRNYTVSVIYKKVGHFQMHAVKPWGSGLNKYLLPYP